MLKEKTIIIEGHEPFTIRELSFKNQLELNAKQDFSIADVYEKCMSEKDFKRLNDLTRKEGELVKQAMNEINFQ